MKPIKAVLFDLDGTLLPMDQEIFVRTYFRELAKKFEGEYDRKSFIDGVWAGVAAMTQNDGSASNYDVFWRKFADLFGERVYSQIDKFEDFYRNEFSCARPVCGFQSRAREAIELIKSRKKRLILASNPVFPMVAQRSRMTWAGIDPDDFEWITSYENSHFCKPNPAYYEEILVERGLSGEDCLMVGNDAKEDLAAERTGMRVYLLTDCLINSEHRELKDCPHGNFDEFMQFLGTVLG